MTYLCACGRPKKKASRQCSTCWLADPQQRPTMVRFWEKVDTSGGFDACWPWLGHLEPNGYGRFYLKGRMRWAHRAAWELLVGPIPKGHEIRHLVCDNPPCCNPMHLATGTRWQNVHDAIDKDRHNRGERNGFAKLTAPMVIAIRAEYARGGVLQRQIAERYGVSRKSVGNAITRRNWAHV